MDHRPIVKALRATGNRVLADSFIAALECSTGSSSLQSSVRQKANKALIKLGLDGNTRFKSIGQGLNKIHDALGQHGIELDDVFSADLFRDQKGERRFGIAMTNRQDPFSPEAISNSVLFIQWYRHENGYEMLAYLS